MTQSDSYPKQFLINLCDNANFSNWVHEEICGVKVSRSKVLPMVKLYKEKQVIGFVLGWFVYNETFYCEDDQLLLNSEITNEIYQKICGRFLIVEKIENEIEVTTDPGAQLGVVYDNSTKVVASSPSVIAANYKLNQDNEVLNNVKRIDDTIWYPFGLVPYKNLNRILPGRKLNLFSGKVTPINYIFENRPVEQPKAITKIISDCVTSNIHSIAKSKHLKTHLTAGYDSRMVLSSCLQSGIKISCQTIKLENTGSKIDCEAAKKITNLLNLNHEIILFEPPSKLEIEDWLERTGFCIRDAVTTLCKTVKNSDDDKFILTGSCGEVGRAFYWQEVDINQNYITPEEIIFRLGFKQSEFLVEHCKRWMKDLNADLYKTNILDLAYIDNRLGCWAGPSIYGHDIIKPTISPFNEGLIYKLMLSLPEKYRLKQQFSTDYISFSCKELLSIPFNRAIGIKKLFYLNHEIRKMIPIKIKIFLKKHKFF